MLKQKTKFKQTEIGMIPEDWEVVRLDEVTINITDGKHGDCKNEENSGYYFISCKDVGNKRIDYSNARRITKEDFEDTHRRTKLEIGDILLTNSGTIGRLAIARDEKLTPKTTFQKSVAILKPQRKVILSEFFYYSLLSNIKRLVETSGGTTQKNLLLKDIRSFIISKCAFPEQSAIAKILSDLDSKIELNHKIKENIEAIGLTLFNNWFNLGDIPENWQRKPLDEIAKFLNGLPLQKYPVEEDEEYLSVIKIRELRNGVTNQTDKASLDVPEEYVIKDGDILFSWSGTLEVEIWTNGRGALNQHLFKVSSTDYPKWFYYYWTKHFLSKFRHIAKGKATTMGHIQKYNLTESEVITPDKKTIEDMNKMMSPIVEKIITIKLESQNLGKIRDMLLPKLMSGKIRVPFEVN